MSGIALHADRFVCHGDESRYAILASIEDYHGLIVDLDTSQSIPPQVFADARWMLTRKMNELGLTPGDRVIVAMGNGPLFIATWAASF